MSYLNSVFASVGIAGFACMIAEVSGIMDHIKSLLTWALYGRYNKKAEKLIESLVHEDTKKLVKLKEVRRLKPFDCSKCLSFWLSISLCLLTRANLTEFIFIVGTAPILSVFIIKLLQR